jgi:16S rRNA (uracil1498-N3)-methyltransferase
VHRFFAPSLDPGDDMVVLPRDEGEHLTRVLRLGVGETVSVFDGRGHEFLARVMAAARRDVQVQLLSRIEPARESTVSVVLVQAVLKHDKMDDVVRDAVMLGVAAVQPLVTRRTETTAAALVRGARLDRWRRVALASAKQSRRAVLPEIRTPLTLETYLMDPPPSLRLMLVEPTIGSGGSGGSDGSGGSGGSGGVGEIESMRVLRSLPTPADVALLVGPEGGWTDAEVALAGGAGARLLSLGPFTLRADAVPVAAISVLQFLWDQP